MKRIEWTEHLRHAHARGHQQENHIACIQHRAVSQITHTHTQTVHSREDDLTVCHAEALGDGVDFALIEVKAGQAEQSHTQTDRQTDRQTPSTCKHTQAHASTRTHITIQHNITQQAVSINVNSSTRFEISAAKHVLKNLQAAVALDTGNHVLQLKRITAAAVAREINKEEQAVSTSWSESKASSKTCARNGVLVSLK